MPEYVCQREGIEHAEPICQRVPGAGIDQAIGELLVEAVNPVALEVTLAVQRELQSRLEEADRLRHAQVERAQYECELAQRRYMRVDPDNRLVADSLEAQWNEKLRELAEAHEEYARRREQDARVLMTISIASAILALTSDFPRLWRDASYARPRSQAHGSAAAGGRDLESGRPDHRADPLQGRRMHETLNLPLPLCGWQQRVTPSAVIARSISCLTITPWRADRRHPQ